MDRLVQWFSYLDRNMLRSILPGLDWSDDMWNETRSAQAEAVRVAGGFDAVSRMQCVDFLTWLPGNLLERGDRMTMQAGLEARCPFLDKDLAPWGIALPRRMKVRYGTGKWVVRQWAKRRLPEQILRRRKWGFRVPLATWFRGHRLRSLLFDSLTRRDGLCGSFGDRRSIGELLKAHDCGKIDSNLALWTLLAAEVWYQDVFLDRDRGTRHGGVPPELRSNPAHNP